MTLPDWMKPAPETLQTRLQRARAGLDLTPPQMAQYLGVPVYTYLKWENGHRTPNASAHRLLDILEQVRANAPKLHDKLLREVK